MYDSTFGQPEHSSLFARCRDNFGSGKYTENCRILRLNAIKLYIRNFVTCFMMLNRWETNPLMVTGTTSYFKELHGLYGDLQWWKQFLTVVNHLRLRCSMQSTTFFGGQPEHSSLFACCCDWFGSGMYTGYHRTPFLPRF